MNRLVELNNYHCLCNNVEQIFKRKSLDQKKKGIMALDHKKN